MNVMLIGGTQVVYHLARRFDMQGHTVTIVHDNQERCEELAYQTKARVIFGEGTDSDILESAGARQCDVVIALTSRDQDNLIACQIADREFGVPRTMAIANDPQNESIFKRLGVKIAFSPTEMIASIVEQEITYDQITKLMPLAQGRMNITDVHLTDDSVVIGQSLKSINLSEKSLIACVIRDGDVIVPRGQTELQKSDHLILIHDPSDHEQDLDLLCERK